MNRRYSIVNKQLITPTTLLVTLKNDEPKRPVAFQPGQYMAVSFKRFGRFMPSRCFSIVSDPTDQDYLQFAMRIKGAFTHASLKAEIGDPAELYGPFGGFIYNVSRDRYTVFLAGGIGITPFISMIRYSSRLHTQNFIHLLYACRNQEDAAFAEELLAFQRVNPRFKVTFILGGGPTDKLEGCGRVGKIDVPLLAEACQNQFLNCSFFVCGPAGFMEEMLGTLRAQQVPEESIITEAFSQGSHKQQGFWKGWPAQVYGLTGLSFLFATFIISARDVVKTQVAATSTSASESQLPSTSSSSREDTLNQQLSNVQNSSQPSSPPASTPSATPTTNASTSTATKPTTTTSTAKTTTSPSTTSPSSPTPSSSPVAVTLSFSANKSSIVKGDSVTLSWSVNSNATTPVSCTASGSTSWSGSKASSGSQTLSPSKTTTYTLSCTNSTGKTSSKSVTITVTQPCVSTPSAPC